MKLIVNEDRSVIPVGTWGTVNENNYEILDFEFPAELENYNKRIVYYLDDRRVWDVIVNNKVAITNAVTTKEYVKAYVWLTLSETITLKYVCDGTEEGNYYFTYDNVNHYFTIPEVSENDELIYDVATNKLKLGNTEIATTATGTGTELTFSTIIDAEEDFRTQLFEMNFYENENADGIVPTPEQVDGFNTMLTAMNAKIDEVDALETTIETAEAQRQEAEATRVSNESTRQSNESTRESNEQTRQSQEAERERRTDEAIGNIEDKTAEYNANAEAKTTAFNQNATQKTNEFNSNYTQKVNDFNSNATSKTNDFNSNASGKTTTFNDNATSKTNTFNSNASSKTTDFNTNAENKTSAFDNNASSKTTTFNENATSKTNDFNDNATQKTTDFNNNAQAKTDAFDEHTAEITADIEELQQEVSELSDNMPWVETEQGTEIDITDAAKYSKNKLELFGNTSQFSTTGVQLLDMSDAVNGYFTGDSGVTNTANEGFHTQEYMDVSGKTTMYARFEALNNIKIGRFWMQEYDENYTSLKRTLIGIYDSTFTKGQVIKHSQNFQANTKYVRFSAYVLKALENDSYVDKHPIKDNWNTYVKAMLSLTEMDTFEPYTNRQPSPSPDYPQPIHVVTGENTIEVQTKNLIDAVLANDTSTVQNIEKSTNLLLQPGTYTIVWFNKPSTSNANLFSGNNVISVAQVGYYTNKRTFEIEQPTLVTKARSSVNANERVYCFLVKGTIAPETYTPYYHADYPINLGSLELCKIGDYQDYLYKENGNWYKYGTISHNIATGASAEQWTWTLRNENKAVVQSNKIGQCIDGRNFIAIFSNYYKGATGSTVFSASDNTVNIIGCAEQNKIRIAVSPNDFADIDDFKNFLQENNLDFYFVLATPTTTQITDTTLISQLDEIYEHLKLVKGTNNITVTAEDLAPYMKLTYMQDLKSKLDNLDSRLALLE